MKPKDGQGPTQKPQAGTMVKANHQAFNAYKGVKKGQSGSVTKKSSKKGY